MSKKPMNFYQGAKGTFRIEILATETVVDGETTITYKATHTYEQIKQAIEDGFLPYCVIKGEQTVYQILYEDSGTFLMFTSEAGTVTIRNNNNVKVEEKESGGSGGGGVMHIKAEIGESDALSPDKTYEEVKSAINNGILPVFTIIMPVGPTPIIFTTCYLVDTTPNGISFISPTLIAPSGSGYKLSYMRVVMTPEGTTGVLNNYSYSGSEV